MKSLLFIFVIAVVYRELPAQQINPYARMTDPRALARLDEPDSQPLRYATRFGYPPDRDPTDGNFILAHDTGAGIITHIWFVYTAPDSTTNFKLYIDDSLIFSGTILSFFNSAHGVLRPPFDTLYPGAQVCDVQMPYKKKFRITYIGEGWNQYYAIAWRPVSDPQLIRTFTLSQSYFEQYNQQSAESVYESNISPWSKEKPSHIYDTVILAPGSKQKILDMKGPAMIQRLKLSFAKYDFNVLDSLWLNIYWDKSPYPAVHAPVADFFCASNGGLAIRSLIIRTDSSGLTSYFPMPFATSATIELVNNSKDSLKSISLIDYTAEKIDKNSYGYFYSFFNEANPARYHIYYKALHELGRGKFVGFSLYCPHNPFAVVLEGGPIFTIDSNPQNYIRYTGGEDYYNSGWWFLGRMFSKPFAGYTNVIQSFYRFHILDAIDFTNSIDLLYQNGKAIDVPAHFRSIAYYYKKTASFWVSRDTIRAGERWNVAGAGYSPNSSIIAKFDNNQTIFTTMTNTSGEFNAVFIIPTVSIYGARKLSINDEIRPEPIYVLANPVIRQIADSLPVTLRYNDSLLVTGAGFDAGEKIQIFLDSILLSGNDTILVSSDNRFFAVVRMPNIAEWKYHLRAVGDHYHEAISEDLITITRIKPFEFEDIVPNAVIDSGRVYSRNLSEFWASHFSHSAAAFFDPKGPDNHVRFKFFIPANDTFVVLFLYTKGPKFGNYSFSIDEKYAGTLKGYEYSGSDDDVHTSDTISLGKIYFTKDTHTFVFKCLGKDSAAKECRLGADLLLLTPTTKMALPKGVFITPKDTSLSRIDSPNVMNSYIILYPNPISSGELTLGLNPSEILPNGRLDIFLSDILGRRLRSEFDIPIGSTGALTHFDVHSLPTGNYLAEFIIHSSSATQRISRMVQIRE